MSRFALPRSLSKCEHLTRAFRAEIRGPCCQPRTARPPKRWAQRDSRLVSGENATQHIGWEAGAHSSGLSRKGCLPGRPAKEISIKEGREDPGQPQLGRAHTQLMVRGKRGRRGNTYNIIPAFRWKLPNRIHDMIKITFSSSQVRNYFQVVSTFQINAHSFFRTIHQLSGIASFG